MSNRNANPASPSLGRKLSLGKKFRGLMRSMLLMTGLFALLCGAVCLLTDRVVLFPNQKTASFLSLGGIRQTSFIQGMVVRTFRPHTVVALPQWAAVTLFAVGAASTLFIVTTRRA